MGRRFEGRRVMVTGVGSGIGAATARAFARERARLLALDNAPEGLARTLVSIREEGGDVIGAEVDVADSASVAAVFQRARDELGGLDVLVNNAGVTGPVALTADVEEPDFDRCLAVNLRGVWLCMRAGLRMMLEANGGTIVNVASTAGLLGARRASPYVASKHAVVGLTRAAALDYASRNIRINAICPGPTETEQTRPLLANPQALEATLRNTPLRRVADPAEIAAAILWVASEDSSFVTGAVFPIDGGLTAQ